MTAASGAGGALRPIGAVSADLGLRPDEWQTWGPGVAKVHPEVARRASRTGGGRLVLVSAITPTAAGEGRTTTSIGLAQALARPGHRSCAALREPSLGPTLGMKDRARPFRPLYDLGMSPVEKIRRVAQAMYGARDVILTRQARADLADAERLGHGDLPVCIARVPGRPSGGPALRGGPGDFELTVRGIRIAAGAGFLVVLTGDVLGMPGLPRKPRAADLDLAADGRIVGLS